MSVDSDLSGDRRPFGNELSHRCSRVALSTLDMIYIYVNVIYVNIIHVYLYIYTEIRYERSLEDKTQTLLF